MEKRFLSGRRAIFAASLALAAMGPLAAHAQKYPERPITLVVGFAPGGAADTVARSLADELTKSLGQPVIIDNRSGASGNIATQYVLGKEPDGYTLLFAAINLATNPWLMGVKYDPQKDLSMVSQITSVPVVLLASNSSGIKTPADIDAAAKRSSGGVLVGSGGVGTSSHLALELYKRARNTAMVHAPYRGGAPANQDLMGGQIDMMFDLMSGSLRSMVDAHRVRPIAVMQSTRIKALPDVKSAGELGLPTSTHIRSWQGIAVRSGTPPDVVARLHTAITAAAQSTHFKARAEQLGSEVVTSKTPKEFDTLYATELARWGGLIKEANIKVE
ncbi:Bug family tripartite tricarboxylate transporter substrate binding protein [Acidovorax sp. LjRoot194]|uniref:Bug family tripartite tricarboxylate transporter substrate binding protein n=1 Tax=Acidovorax sp. LjRoot194 TaxID=3342280 RepID=UPI003ECC239F